MKTFLTLALALVLTAGLLIGCGCTNTGKDETTTPTGMTTAPTTMPTAAPTTMPTTQPATEEPSSTGNGMLEDETTGASGGSTEATGNASRSGGMGGSVGNSPRGMMPGAAR